MIRGLLLGLAMVGLSGCTDEFIQDTTRQTAKGVITPIVAAKFPGRNAPAYSDCIIDNATTNEIFSLAGDAISGVDAETVSLVVKISTRPDTVKCFVRVETGLSI